MINALIKDYKVYRLVINEDFEVEVYRNLQRKCYSLTYRGTIFAYVKEITILNPRYLVAKAGRLKVLAEKVKNVHARIKGKISPRKLIPINGELVIYDPYKTSQFTAMVDQGKNYLCNFDANLRYHHYVTLNGDFTLIGSPELSYNGVDYALLPFSMTNMNLYKKQKKDKILVNEDDMGNKPKPIDHNRIRSQVELPPFKPERIECLNCRREFKSFDKKKNRLCKACREKSAYS